MPRLHLQSRSAADRDRNRTGTGTVFVLLGLAAWSAMAAARAAPIEPIELPGAAGSLKFVVIGDTGAGDKDEVQLGQQMAAARAAFPFQLVLMLGDNLYGSQEPDDIVVKFETPYRPLLEAGVPFYAALGNHDKPTNCSYKLFNMGGQRYYTFERQGVRFFVFDTNLMDPGQLAWIETALSESWNAWKIAYFHHPLYSSGRRHGGNVELRVLLEPLFVRHGVDVALSGHEHVYERLKPQKGITYFVQGSSGKLRKGDIRWSPDTAAAFDEDHTFMLVEIVGDRLFFKTISRTGRIVDSGVIPRRPVT